MPTRSRACASRSKPPEARLLYLPPYRADFNPIELAWAKLKHSLRRVGARTSEALDRAIGGGLHAVIAQDAHGFFKHCGYLGKPA